MRVLYGSLLFFSFFSFFKWIFCSLSGKTSSKRNHKSLTASMTCFSLIWSQLSSTNGSNPLLLANSSKKFCHDDIVFHSLTSLKRRKRKKEKKEKKEKNSRKKKKKWESNNQYDHQRIPGSWPFWNQTALQSRAHGTHCKDAKVHPHPNEKRKTWQRETRRHAKEEMRRGKETTKEERRGDEDRGEERRRDETTKEEKRRRQRRGEEMQNTVK